MLWSLSLVFLAGFSLSGLFKRFHLPGLLGMMITGILLGPYLLNLIDESILGISSELRKMALVVILLRAGLSLDLDDLKKVGRPAFLLSFLPALLEIGAITLVAPLLFGFTHLESALLAAVLAAVSPAVIVPRMIRLFDTGHGQKKRIPQMILAGSSVDDVFVIVLFVLVGAAVNIHLIPVAGLAALALILFGLVFRSAGVGLSLFQTNLNRRERLFCVFSYLPKATVQAAIGAVPFSLGLPAGEMILAIAVLSILFTAPVGALLMDRTYALLLKKE